MTKSSDRKEEYYIILTYPNKTKVRISGDINIIRQIMKALDGLEITYVSDEPTVSV